MLAIDPKAIGAFTGRAEVRYSQKDYAGAVEDTTMALQVDGKNIDALLLRGFASEAIQREDDGAADYQAILKIDPTHKLARANLERLGKTALVEFSRCPPARSSAAQRCHTA